MTTSRIKPHCRPPHPADLPQLADLWVTLLSTSVQEILGPHKRQIIHTWLADQERYRQTMVAEIDRELVGLIATDSIRHPPLDDLSGMWRALRLYYPRWESISRIVRLWLVDSPHQTGPDELYIELIGIAPAWRRQGTAQLLLTEAVQQARQMNLARITLSVRRDNHSAQSLYQRVGFAKRVVRWSMWRGRRFDEYVLYLH